MNYAAAPPSSHRSTSSTSFEAINRSLARAQDHLRTSTSSLDKLHEKVTLTSAQISDLQAQITNLRVQLAGKYHELEEYQDLIPHAEGEVDRARARVGRLEECVTRVEKEMRVEAWMEEMEREEETEQEGFKKYLQEVGRSAPDNFANVEIRSPPLNDSDSDVAADIPRVNEIHGTASDDQASPPTPPMNLPTLIGTPKSEANPESFRPTPMNRHPMMHSQHHHGHHPLPPPNGLPRMEVMSPHHQIPMMVSPPPPSFPHHMGPVQVPLQPYEMQGHPGQFMPPEGAMLMEFPISSSFPPPQMGLAPPITMRSPPASPRFYPRASPAPMTYSHHHRHPSSASSRPPSPRGSPRIRRHGGPYGSPPSPARLLHSPRGSPGRDIL